MIHAVAAAAARATCCALVAESKRYRLAALRLLPTSIKSFDFRRIHAPHRRARRDTNMRKLLPNTVR